MSREKQIEEMEKVIADAFMSDYNIGCDPCTGTVATALYLEGYRKQSEGEWVWNPNGMDWGLGAWECSSCRCRNDNLPMDKNTKPMLWAGSKFCPNCGAKMKGGAE